MRSRWPSWGGVPLFNRVMEGKHAADSCWGLMEFNGVSWNLNNMNRDVTLWLFKIAMENIGKSPEK